MEKKKKETDLWIYDFNRAQAKNLTALREDIIIFLASLFPLYPAARSDYRGITDYADCHGKICLYT